MKAESILENIFEEERGISKRLRTWQGEVRPLIESQLKIAANWSERLKYELNDSRINGETLMLSFKIRPSVVGFNPESIANRGVNFKPIFEKGGYLSFSINPAGYLNVWMKYPEIEGIIRSIEEYKDIEKFVDLEKITPELIKSYIKQFFTEVLAWKKMKKEYNPIRF